MMLDANVGEPSFHALGCISLFGVRARCGVRTPRADAVVYRTYPSSGPGTER